MSKAFDCAMRLLSRREHGAFELYTKLQHKGFSATEAQEALEKCQELDVQNDVRYVEIFIRVRIRQGYGPIKISADLKAKHIDLELIHSALSQEKDNWLDYALTVWQKKCNNQQLSLLEQQKQQRFMLYRGFSMDTIQQVVKEVQ